MILALGSNLGDRKRNLDLASDFIHEELGKVIHRSGMYRTASWGFKGPEFLNSVLICETELAPEEALEKIKAYEREKGRVKRIDQYEDRPIDIDILYYGEQIVDVEGLHIPHRAMAARRFVLAPLAEILPDHIHPIIGKSSRELLDNCPDNHPCELLK